MQDVIFNNANLVLQDEVYAGSLAITNGMISDMGSAVSANASSTATPVVDCDGDYLFPGLVELHTDHLEGHYMPRPAVKWHPVAAVQAHDAQIAGAGITTVLDALRLGLADDNPLTSEEIAGLGEAIMTSSQEGYLRADHLLHLRCEVSAASVLDDYDKFRGNSAVRLVSLMDHTPGQRQFQSMEVYARYYKGKLKMNDEEFARFVEEQLKLAELYSDKHRKTLAELCQEDGVTLASHDDATLAHVDDSLSHGVKIAEFPTTIEAAKSSHENGLAVLMGAPNVVRGGSHSGNVAATELNDEKVLDVLSSDYVPSSLLQAVFLLAERQSDGNGLVDLPKYAQMVTATPAKAVGLDDRGALVEGLRGDVIRVKHVDGIAVMRAMWRTGIRVM